MKHTKPDYTAMPLWMLDQEQARCKHSLRRIKQAKRIGSASFAVYVALALVGFLVGNQWFAIPAAIFAAGAVGCCLVGLGWERYAMHRWPWR